MPNNIGNNPSSANQNGEIDMSSLTPELVNKITDMVYRLLMEDLKIEQERTGFGSKFKFPGGY